jgi:hypothetical protein
MPLRGTIIYILARHGLQYHGATAKRAVGKSAATNAQLIENEAA